MELLYEQSACRLGDATSLKNPSTTFLAWPTSEVIDLISAREIHPAPLPAISAAERRTAVLDVDGGPLVSMSGIQQEAKCLPRRKTFFAKI